MAKKNKSELSKEQRKAILKDVKDLINQALIKMKDVGEIEYNEDYDGEGGLFAKDYSGVPLDEEGELDTNSDEYYDAPEKDQELECLKDVLESLVSGSSERVAEKYHTSTCW